MKRFLSSSYLALTLIVFSLPYMAFALQQEELPDLNARVTDLTGTLHGNEIAHINSKLETLEASKGSQLVVVIIPTTGDETIEQYGIRLAEKWRVGRKDIDDGVILIIAKKDRKLRIEVAYGLEGAIPDAYSKRIIEEIIVPQFRSGDFYHGIDQGVDAIISLVNGEELPMPHEDDIHPVAGGDLAKYFVLFPFVFILLTVINYFAKKKLGKRRGAFVAPLILFVVGWWFINIIGGVLVAMFSLIFLNIPGGRGRGGGGYTGGRYYGSSGSYSIGGGSGGFSGGGGSFGGGGASGSW